MADAQRESKLKRWFGKEHNPERAALTKQAMRYQGPADCVALLGIWLCVMVHILVGLPLVVLGLWMFAKSVMLHWRRSRDPPHM